MKRSEINKNIREAFHFFTKNNFLLPTWAGYTVSEWKQYQPSAKEIFENQLGWDITDFATHDFEKVGLTLFTIRNGNPNLKNYTKTYAEKIMMVKVNQLTPMHFHWKKMEDIINRAGGKLCLQLWKADQEEKLSNESFSVQIDGMKKQVSAGEIVVLNPGESITLEPFVYHKFWAEGEVCMIGEVSQVNDDNTDNRFLEPLGRFPEIEEDEAPFLLLCNEYKKLFT